MAAMACPSVPSLLPGPTSKVVLASEQTLMKWPNGLAATTELFVFPPRGSFETLQFVISVHLCKITDSCSYPYIAGATRLVGRLEGGPLILNHNNRADSHIMKPRTSFYEFKGHWSTYCEVDRPATDLHVTFHTSSASATSRFIKYSADPSFDVDEEDVEFGVDPCCAVLIYHASGEPLTIHHGQGASTTLRVGDTLILNPLFSEDRSEDIDCKVVPPEHGEALIVFVSMEKEDACVGDDQPAWAMHALSEDSKSEFSSVETPHVKRLEKSQGRSTGDAHLEWTREPYFPPAHTPPMPAPPPDTHDRFSLDNYERGRISTCWLNILNDGFGEWVRIPLIVARGVEDGPVLGITAAVHGNELNGIPCVHRLMGAINVQKLKGTVVACPCVNTHGYTSFKRTYRDGADLNRTFPGKPNGTQSQVFCYHLLEKLVKHFEYHLDLHTASFGRINSYYVRADMNDPVVADMAWLCNPQIILHNSGQDGTLRGCATSYGIKCLTIEIGNPQMVQSRFVSWTYAGCRRILDRLGMYRIAHGGISRKPPNKAKVVLCSGGYWMYTKHGGVLEVFPPCNSILKEGQLIARVKNIFGTVVEEVFAPDGGGVTVGRSSNPVAFSGDRIIHIGLVHDKDKPLPEAAGENY